MARLWACLFVWGWLGFCLPAQAVVPPDITEMRLDHTDEGLFLSAALRFDLPTLAEDALQKGIPIYFITEADVLAAMQRIARWKIAEPETIDPQARYNVQLRFRLDLSQLPRPLQIGAMGRSGWNLSMARSQRFAVEPQR